MWAKYCRNNRASRSCPSVSRETEAGARVATCPRSERTVDCPGPGTGPRRPEQPSAQELSALRRWCWPLIHLCCVCFRNLLALWDRLRFGAAERQLASCVLGRCEAGGSSVTYRHGWRRTF